MELNGRIGAYMVDPYSAETRKQQVSQQMKELRKRANLTQREVCEIIRVTPQTYSGYEKGKYEPTLETIVRLALLYEVSTDHILCAWVNEDEEAASAAANEMWNEQLHSLSEEVERLKFQMAELKAHQNEQA